jgi:hypothetical protein
LWHFCIEKSTAFAVDFVYSLKEAFIASFFVSSGVANLHRSLLVTPAISSAGVTWKYFLEKEKYYP